MDPQALNYNSSATINDGSCNYPITSYSLQTKGTLNSKLTEISGMIYWNGKLYAHGDSGNPNKIYEIDTITGTITKTITIGSVSNVDWEDLTQDATHIYIEDAGNNNGDRTDLVIYKFPKSAIVGGSNITISNSQIDSIFFSYPDQTTFNNNSNTPFDCEALAYRNNKLHLFSKNRSGGYCVHYTLPTIAGTYIAAKHDSLNTNGMLVTGADFSTNKELMLIGYYATNSLECALWFITDFNNDTICFNTGNKRMIGIGTFPSVGQVEGICFKDSTGGFASNERFNPNQAIDVPAKLYRFNSTAWYPYPSINLAIQPLVWVNNVSIASTNNCLTFYLNLLYSTMLKIQLIDLNGKVVFNELYSKNSGYQYFSTRQLELDHAVYIVRLSNEQGLSFVQKIIL